MTTPSIDEYLDLERGGKRVPVRRRIPADLETPVSTFLKLRAHGAVFLLESVEQGIQVGRYSFIGISPYAVHELKDGIVEIRRKGRVERFPVDIENPFRKVREELTGAINLDAADIPGPFAGAVGYVSYDMVRHFERVADRLKEGIGLPDYRLIFPGTLAVFDHVKSEIEVLVLPPEGDPKEAYTAAVRKIEEILAALESPLSLDKNPSASGVVEQAVPNMSEESFKQKVLQAKEHILAGDAFQIVLSRRLHGTTECPPFRIYRALRILNPSPYMFFMDMDGFQIIGSSPEVLVKLERGKATLCPIAGTRPRGATPAEDVELERELLECEKERAEHVMLVDLGRNDLGRVCETGSVRTESLMQVEKYSHVMHIVSRISGELRKGLDMFDLLRSAFPAGTVTGAPKIRAIEIIHELEEESRGPYAGAVGYLGRQGDMDMCIAIRTLIVRGNEYYAQAGAGIVADSDPDFELRETESKILALIRAIAIAEEGF